jgi:hypothetical protein
MPQQVCIRRANSQDPEGKLRDHCSDPVAPIDPCDRSDLKYGLVSGSARFGGWGEWGGLGQGGYLCLTFQ